MYKRFFNFRERPFQLVPNPEYLFLSKCHEEALAHISYAIEKGDGFVEMTGEVGTGKTTLCRAFFEKLDGSVEAAFIFNPRLNEIELLKTINDEFGINSSFDNVKDLTDTLNRFLIKKKSENKKIVVIVDEAQNLEIRVLEQLRLLSNLETTKDKLLQIVLSGQPELTELLASYELRQLSQRVTLSAHLTPLSYSETCYYIRHRISIASRTLVAFFSKAALKKIYRHSNGIPRRINVLSDKALIVAYGEGEKVITGKMVNKVIAEDNLRLNSGPVSIPYLRPALLFLIVIIIGSLFIFNRDSIFTSDQPVPEATLNSGEFLPNGTVVYKKIPKKKELTTVINHESITRFSRYDAASHVINMWGEVPDITNTMDEINDSPMFFKQMAKLNGFSLYKLNGGFELMKLINLPGIVEIKGSEPLSVSYVIVNGFSDLRVKLFRESGPDKEEPRDQFKEQMTENIYIFWRNFASIHGVIPDNASGDSIIALKILMDEIGFNDIEITATYDSWTEENIRFFQNAYGMDVDGVVGTLTKIMLYNTKDGLAIPHLEMMQKNPVMAGESL